MRIAAIACAAVIGLAGSSAWAECNWTTATAKTSGVVASATSATPAPAQSTPVRLPEGEKQG